jgi:acyl-CoA thioester hydrolase
MYYGNYARLYEIGRVEALRSVGFRYKEMEDDGVMMPVYDNYSRYHAPALYDDLLTIRVLIKAVPAVRMVFDYEILDSQQKLLHEGKTTLVFVKIANNRLVPAPKHLIDLMKMMIESNGQ